MGQRTKGLLATHISMYHREEHREMKEKNK